MRLVLDVENSVTWKEGKIYNDPFEPGNTLTQIGMVNADDHTELHVVNLDHVEAKDTSGAGHNLVQAVLDSNKNDILDIYKKESYDNYVTGGGTGKTESFYKEKKDKYHKMGLYWECVHEDIEVDKSFK